MSAQIIPFPSARVHAHQANAGRIESDPSFWVFCDRERRSADQSGRPRPLHAELRARYMRDARPSNR